MKQAILLIFVSRLYSILTFLNLDKGALQQKNIFIAVKTTQKHEKTRLTIILDTWFTLAKDQVWFFTDEDKTDEFKSYQNITKNHMVITNCPKTHNIIDLCCKTNAEISINLSSSAGEKIKWLCLFDDDNYVNVPKLVEELQKYDYKTSWYLGRKYLKGRPSAMQTIINNERNHYYFANLGAGVCLSRALLLEMDPCLRNDGFVQLCKTLRLPDAISLGFLIEKKIGVNLTDVPTFNSHLDPLKDISCENLKDQISVGYDFNRGDQSQTITVPGFHLKEDPSRFYSLHCFLRFCSDKLKQRFKTEATFSCPKSQATHNPHRHTEVEVTTVPPFYWTSGQKATQHQPIFSPARQTSRKYDSHAPRSKSARVLPKSPYHTWTYHGTKNRKDNVFSKMYGSESLLG